MHDFSDLVRRGIAFNLSALEVARTQVIDAMQTSAATPLVKAAQMIQLQKAIYAVGMFSMFDAILQDRLQCVDGFKEVGVLLEANGASQLKERFADLQLAINVLKHGKGRSYDALVQKAADLPFRIKLPGEAFFDEGDVAEVSTLVEVDDAFLLLCAEVIHEVSVSVI